MKSVCIFLVCLMLSLPAVAGTISDFEYDASKKNEEPANKEKPAAEEKSPGKEGLAEGIAKGFAKGVGEGFGESIGNILVGGIVSAIAYGGGASIARVEGNGYGKYEIEPRKAGEALIPFVSVDVSYQDVESDVTAADVRGEIGYGSLGIQARQTRYWEDEPKDGLTATQVHGLYRMSIGSKAELDLGIGSLFLEGDGSNSGVSFTAPVLIHPSDFFGFEFRPAWSSINENTINDYDAALLLGWRFASLRVGYRWFMTAHESLNGPQVGIAMRW